MRHSVLHLALVVLTVPAAAYAQLPPDIKAEIVKMGHVNDDAIEGIFAPLHGEVPADIKVTRDLSFGSDPLQKLDMFTSGGGTGKTILVYVHGGGFTGGDKHRPGDFRYDNVMIWAVRNGMVGAEINYRLAPKNVYPDANEDVAAAIKYIRNHAREHGGDPGRIVVWGHSAGASLVGILVSHPEFLKASGGTIAAALMTSGAYEFTTPHVYLGKDPAMLAERSSVEGLKKSDIPLFFTRAEWDPLVTMQQGDMINKVLCDAGKCPTFFVMNTHNHMSQVYSINTADKELAGHILAFIQRTTAIKPVSVR